MKMRAKEKEKKKGLQWNEFFFIFFSGPIVTTAYVVSITAKIAFIFTSYPQFTYIIFINLHSAPILSGLHL